MEPSKTGWYHNAHDSYETEIKYCADDPDPFSVNWRGPFRTWGEAKQDAIGYHRGNLNSSKYAIRLLKQKRKKSGV